MKKYNRFIFLVGLLLAIFSCDERELLSRYPKDTPNPENFFYNEATAQSAIAATFYPWSQGNSAHMLKRDMVIMFDAMTDDSYFRPARSASVRQERWDITPTSSAIEAYWRFVYASVNASNFAIEGIPKSLDPAFSSEKQLPFIAQAKFMRAFDYLFLTTFFGDVPLNTKTLSSFDEFNPTVSTRAEIFEQIIEDFTFAKENLPIEWPMYQGAPTKAAAAAYLAKAYLYRASFIDKDYTHAENAARDAIQIAESSGYRMIDDYESIWAVDNEANPELLLYFSYTPEAYEYSTYSTAQRMCRDCPVPFKSIWGNGATGYALPQRDLYDAFEEGDSRRKATMFAPGDFYGYFKEVEPFNYTHLKYDENGDSVQYSITYNTGDSVQYDYRWSPTGLNVKKLTHDLSDLTNYNWSGLDYPVMRMADLYLFLAEALAEQGKDEALVWINKVRSRPSVNMPPKTAADGNLIDIVRNERRVELAMEGVRLYDLMRWGNIGEIFSTPTSVKRHFYSDYLESDNVESRFDAPDIRLPANFLFPIPQMEIDRNNNINSNNMGYD
ncbi:RagB/SusD family nutrient uptake outer membrane protein [Mariniphaga sediminis]|uniref:RagB/SusD family nutrient uptake outer membrane protein n=1 Tax=Mariniphaga sediminis TaxID=1628158 RepID=UPI0035615C23